MRGQQLVFCQRHISRTSYRNKTDWLQYRINLVTRVPVDSQQKTDISINDQLDPKIILMFSALTRYAKWCLLCVVSYFCSGNRSEHGKSIVSNNYKNQ